MWASKSFFLFLSTWYTICFILLTVVFGDWALISIKSSPRDWASFLISGEKVAEKSKFCLIGGVIAIIFLISWIKPISSIWSASSSTSILTRSNFTAFWLTKSSNLPGVATKISTPFLSLDFCGKILAPPKTAVDLIFVNLPYLWTFSLTWAASSRVGVSMRAWAFLA